MLACVLFTAFLRGESAFWAHSLHKALMCMAVAAVWFGYETYLRPLEGRRLVTFLLPFSFFIFVAQEPLLTMLKRLGLRELGSSDAAMLFVYFAAPLLTLVAVVAVAAALRRYLPTPYAWLTGGRGGRERPPLTRSRASRRPCAGGRRPRGRARPRRDRRSAEAGQTRQLKPACFSKYFWWYSSARHHLAAGTTCVTTGRVKTLALGELRDRGERRLLLVAVVEEDRGAVLVADVRALPVPLRRVVRAEEVGEELLVADHVRVELEAYRLGVTGPVRADVLVGGVLGACRRCSRPRCW